VRVERRVLPVCPEPERRAEVFERELWRIAVEHLDYGEQHVWAALAGARVQANGWRRARAMLHFDRDGELRRRFLLTAVQRNPNPALRLKALSEIAAARDPDAFDSAIDMIGTWSRDERREGAKVMLQAMVDKRIGRRDQANAWIWRMAEYTREVHEEYAVQRWPETKRLLGLLVNSSGAAHARNARRLVQAARKQDRRLAAALLAAALAHSPEAEEVLRGARTRMARKPPALARELLRNFPKRRGRGKRRRRRGGELGEPLEAGAVPIEGIAGVDGSVGTGPEGAEFERAEPGGDGHETAAFERAGPVGAESEGADPVERDDATDAVARAVTKPHAGDGDAPGDGAAAHAERDAPESEARARRPARRTRRRAGAEDAEPAVADAPATGGDGGQVADRDGAAAPGDARFTPHDAGTTAGNRTGEQAPASGDPDAPADKEAHDAPLVAGEERVRRVPRRRGRKAEASAVPDGAGTAAAAETTSVAPGSSGGPGSGEGPRSGRRARSGTRAGSSGGADGAAEVPATAAHRVTPPEGADVPAKVRRTRRTTTPRARAIEGPGDGARSGNGAAPQLPEDAEGEEEAFAQK
jgi:hypothetical protein